jgi:hypothetical protein
MSLGRKLPTTHMIALGTLYQSVNVFMNMLLKKNINTTCMRKTYIVTSYLMNITKLRDHIITTRDIVEDNELIHICLNRFSPP